jgi:hypothetical protein
MRNETFIACLVAFAAQAAMAGAGSDQPTNITITNPYKNLASQAQFCWNTVNQSDSLVMIGETGNFSRQVHDGTLTTNHCVVVSYLQPNQLYYYSVASCTDPVNGKQCARTDTNWSSAPWPTNTPTFTTASSTSGSLAFAAFASGPSYTYQSATMEVGINLIQTSGVMSQDYIMFVTSASVDGYSCMPGTLLGANCGQTGIALTMLCDNSREEVNPPTNNYPVTVWTGQVYTGDYFCWNAALGEPGMEAKIVAGQLALSGLAHTLKLTFQLVNYKTNTAVGDPQSITYRFSAFAPPRFKVTAPTSFPPIPNYVGAIYTAGRWGALVCNRLTAANAQGIYLNTNLSVGTSEWNPWNTYTYDGNRVFKYMSELFDGVTGGQWQPNHSYSVGDTIVYGGYTQVVTYAGTSGNSPPPFTSNPGDYIRDGSAFWSNAGNKQYWTNCSETIGMQYLNWALNVAKWTYTNEWNIFPWGMYMDFLRQGDVLNENCDGGPTCSGLNAASNLRFGANILTYPTQGYGDQAFTYTYYMNQVGTIRDLPYNTNVLLVDWLETGVPPANELRKRVDMLLQTVSEATKYDPTGPNNNYVCCYSASNFNVGLWAMTLIETYNVETYMNSAPDARIPVELMKLLDWFYSTQANQLGNDYTFPYQPWAVPYNCSIFNDNSCANNTGWGLNELIAPAYAWLGAVYGDSCKLSTSGAKCWDAADQLFGNAWQGFTGSNKNFNQLFQDFSNYVGWRTGTMPGTDSYVLPTHNKLAEPYPDIIGPYPSAAYPAKPIASNITNSTATITWYTFEMATSTVVKVGTDSNNINIETDCGPGIYTGSDNIWINTCNISGLKPNTQYFFGVGGTDAANNFAFSAVDPASDYFKFTTMQ